MQGNVKSLLHMKPEFFIVGTQKGGTTSLYNYLAKHPCVLPAKEKEIHYFTEKFSNGNSWYISRFPSRFKKLQQALRCHHNVLTGEATPYYLFHPHVPARICESFPNAKIIMMLRNPVDRAFSHYCYHVKLNAETLSFEEAIEAESERLQGELDRFNADVNYQGDNFKIYSYLKRGLYIEQVKRWFELFPNKQILIIKSEDFFSDSEMSFNAVQNFLGLPAYKMKLFKKFNQGSQQSMKQETREKLVEYYKPYNKALSDFLNIDFNWDN